MKCKNCGHQLAHDLTGKKDKIVHHNQGKYGTVCMLKGKHEVHNLHNNKVEYRCTCPKPVPDDIENLNKDMFNAFAGFFR